MIVTFDTNLLIWGVQGVSKVGQEDMIPRAKALISWLDKHGDQLVLTSHSVAEYIPHPDEAWRKRQMAELQSKYVVLPYDAKAAAIAGFLRSDKEFLKSIQDDIGKKPVCIKSDIVVVATAKAHGIQQMFSNDRGIHALCKRCGLSVKDVPTLEELSEKKEPEKSSRPVGQKELFPEATPPNEPPPHTIPQTPPTTAATSSAVPAIAAKTAVVESAEATPSITEGTLGDDAKGEGWITNFQSPPSTPN